MNTIKPQQIINLLAIMFMYNIISCYFMKKERIDSHQNLSFMKLLLNSINLNIFIMMLDNFIFDINPTFNKIKIGSYIISIVSYLIIKKFIHKYY
tara:strand:+ start:762 stop:1046 length:285 start_codon:yes stop_codon:yes gene_type:complete